MTNPSRSGATAPAPGRVAASTRRAPRVRLAVVVSHPIQHFGPWHRDVAATGALDLRVLFCSRAGLDEYHDPGFGRSLRWDVALTEGYEHEFLPPRRERAGSGWRLDNPDVGGRLDAFGPDVVKVFGYAHRTSWRVRSWARSRRRPVLLFSDSSDIYRTPFPRSLAKRAVVSAFYRGVDGALAMGDSNRAYHLRYGIPPGRVFPGVCPVDRSRLLGPAGQVSTDRDDLRASLGIEPAEFAVLFSGKLIDRKRPGDVIAACDRLWRAGLRARPLIVGDGPLADRVRSLAASAACRPILTGFVNQSRVPSLYRAADVLVVSSDHDPHPLVVTEGAVFGLPVVVSDRIGCIGPSDSARPGANALVYRCGDEDALARSLAQIAADPALRERMARAAGDIGVASASEVAADLLVDAVQRLAAMGKR